MRPFLVLTFLLLGFTSIAQIKKIYKSDAELTFGFNNRRTHIYNQFGTIYGLKVGVNFDRRLKNTFGVSSTIFPIGKAENEGKSYKTARLHFASLMEEFIFYRRGNLNFSTYFNVGYGFNFKEVFDQNSILTAKIRETIAPIEFGLQSSYLMISWLEFKVGAGWRVMVLGADDGLNGYFFKLGAGIKYKAFKRAFGI